MKTVAGRSSAAIGGWSVPAATKGQGKGKCKGKAKGPISKIEDPLKSKEAAMDARGAVFQGTRATGGNFSQNFFGYLEAQERRCATSLHKRCVYVMHKSEC